MDLKKALGKMKELLALMDERYENERNKKDFPIKKRDQIIGLYGEIEDVIHQFEGIEEIEVRGSGIHKDWISAGWLSGYTYYRYQGRVQLVKLIGKLEAQLEDPSLPEPTSSVELLLRTLRRFRECCQFIESPPKNERQVQDIIWVMLRAQFDRLDREDNLPRFGVKSYKPDFGVPDLRTLLEVKYIGSKTSPSSIQEEILADVPGYLNNSSIYTGLIVFVYDASHKLLDSRKFIEDLRGVEGIVDVIVMPGIGGL
jgi:hypothetical protein